MSFEKELLRLNKAQRLAVDAIDGPLLVVAGPGTGKTQLLAMRVANILHRTDTDASGILCLTFTNKASTNMRGRILELTNQAASDVVVKTFHSFASEVMNTYPDYFWSGAKLSLAPDALQLEIVQDILASLPLDNPLALKFMGTYTLTDDVLNGLKLAKEAGLTPQKLAAIISHNFAYLDEVEPIVVEALSDRLSYKKLADLQHKIDRLPGQPVDAILAPLVSLSTVLKESLSEAVEKDAVLGTTLHSGKWKKRWVQTVGGTLGMHQERKRNEWWSALAEVYEQYRAALHQSGYYDYSDMLVEVISQIEARPEIRADLQERFMYVMIDEFQDTNAAQLRLAHLIADHHLSNGSPNLMAVGDDDQSIFKFNGAELSNMLMFRRTYPKTQTVVLVENYRSTQEILDTAQKIIDKAEDRLTKRDPSLHKKLIATSKVPKGKVRLLEFPSREHQLSSVAKEIQRAFDGKSSVAVIARGHESLRQLASRLHMLAVPVHYEQQRNVLDHPVVNQVIWISKAVEAMRAGDKAAVNIAIANVVQHPMWNISPKELWEIALKNYRQADWLSSLETSDNSSHKWIADWLRDLSRLSADSPLSLLLEYVLGLRELKTGVSPLRDYYTRNELDANGYLSGLSAIAYLRHMANEYSGTKQTTLQDFMNFVTIEKENNKIVTDQSAFVTGSTAVSLLTVHKAKGLEFDSVYVIDSIEKNWTPRVGGRKPPANLPLQPPGDEMDDYARLMFVATSRAKRFLTICYYTHDQAGNETLPSSLIASVCTPTHMTSPDTDIIDVIEDSIRWPSLSSTDMKLALQSRLENYSLSVTHLLNFLDVSKGGPHYFNERNLLRLPEPKTATLAHGTAMHDALELAQKLVNQTGFDLAKVINQYIESIHRQHLPRRETERYVKAGELRLRELFESKLVTLEKGVIPEQKLRDVWVGEARLNGKIDLLSIDGKKLVVSDYKTGRPLSSFETKDATQQIRAWKQRTQLIYYALLIKHSPQYKKYRHLPVVGQMIYLDAETKHAMYKQYEPTDKEIDHLEILIQKVWRAIMSYSLPKVDAYSKDYRGIVKFQEDLLKN
jgi:DNA helicase-2/ATP-dependent DNA helicase PcrA